jgi:hypothetical protein
MADDIICKVCNNECQMCDTEYQCIECEHLEKENKTKKKLDFENERFKEVNV